MFDLDLLGEGVKIEQGSNILNQIFNLFARYIRKVHSDEFIYKCLCYAPGRRYLDVVGPGDIANIISIIKNSKDMWDQDLRMQELGAQAIGSQDKNVRRCLMVLRRALRILIKKRFANANLVE